MKFLFMILALSLLLCACADQKPNPEKQTDPAQPFYEALIAPSQVKDSLPKSHIDSKEFTDSVLLILDSALKQ